MQFTFYVAGNECNIVLMNTLLFIALVILFLSAVLLDKAYKTISIKELRRRARSGKDKGTASIYKLVALGASLKLFLWLVGVFSAAGILLVCVNHSKTLAGVALLLGAWLALSGRSLKINGILWRIAAIISVPTFKILNFLHPVLSKLSKFVSSIVPITVHTGIYDKEDLLELLNNQNNQVDNRIAGADLKIAFGALTFGDKLIRDVMVPRRQVKIVASSDAIGPLLMDELHKSGFSRFPVVSAPTKEANPEIVGTLYIKDLMDHLDRGRVADVMKKGAHYINEDQSLRDALNIFLKTQHHLLVVVNKFEEIAGVISLEDVMEQILGQQIVDEFDRHPDLRELATNEAQKEQKLHSEQ
jgi:CBS domain containing-hemolysin-like protein